VVAERSRALRAVVRGLVVAGGFWAGAAPAGAQAVIPEVGQVRFIGNETFPQDSLARAIATRPTRCKHWTLRPFCWTGFDFARDRFELRPRELPRDMVRLQIWYQQRGFREVAVDTLPTTFREDGRAVVGFTIDEGRPVLTERIDVEGAGGDPDTGLGPDLLEDLPLRQGDRLNSLALDATRDTLIRRLRDRGYAHADVLRQSFIPADRPYAADVTFEVEPGRRARYGEISVTGTQSLDVGTVERTLQFQTGDLYRVSQLDAAQGRLFGMQIVRSAQVLPNLDAGPDSIVPISVDVREGDAYRVRAGAGWTSAECLNVESTWTSRNFMGGARILRLRARASNLLTREFGDLLCNVPNRTGAYEDLTWVASADFAQPWIFSTRNSLGASVFAERQSVPDIFIRHAVGLELALTRTIGPGTPLTLSYRPERSRLDAAEVLFCTGLLICSPEDVAVLSGTNILAPVGINFTRDRANDLLNPSDGYRMAIDVEHAAAWTGSDFAYERVSVEGASYMALSPSTVLASRLRVGWVGSGGFDELAGTAGGPQIVHPQKRFYAGGANSVRGFAQNRLGPRVLTVRNPAVLLTPLRGDGGEGGGRPPVCTPAQLMDLSCDVGGLEDEAFLPRATGGTQVFEANLELRFGLGRGLEFVTFADLGQAWASAATPAVGDLEVAPGLGVRFLTPVGPIRIDLGYRFRGAERLPVIVAQIAEAEAGRCDGASPPAECVPFGGTYYVPSGDLSVLETPFLYGASGSFWRRVQLHFSIGQAF